MFFLFNDIELNEEKQSEAIKSPKLVAFDPTVALTSARLLLFAFRWQHTIMLTNSTTRIFVLKTLNNQTNKQLYTIYNEDVHRTKATNEGAQTNAVRIYAGE
jgi:hypothetical protein